MRNQFLPIFRLALIVLLSLIFSNCEKDEIVPIEETENFYPIQQQRVVTKTGNEVSLGIVNYLKLKSQNSMYVNMYKHHISLSDGNIPESTNDSMGTISTNKEVVVTNQTNTKHTFNVIIPNTVDTKINLIVVETEQYIYEYFLKYIYTSTTTNEHFTGTIEAYDQDGNLIGNAIAENGSITMLQGRLSPDCSNYEPTPTTTSTSNDTTTTSSSNASTSSTDGGGIPVPSSDTGSNTSSNDTAPSSSGSYVAATDEPCTVNYYYACSRGYTDTHDPRGRPECSGNQRTSDNLYITDCNGIIENEPIADDPCNGATGVILNDIFSNFDIFTDAQQNWLEENPEYIGEVERFLRENGVTEENLTIVYITLEIAMTNNLLTPHNQATNDIMQSNLDCCGFGLPIGSWGFVTNFQAGVVDMAFMIMLEEYPENHQFTKWELFVIILRAQKEYFHYALDAGGMAPVFGVFFDVTNASIYAMEMDWGNMTMSLGAAVPVGGQWVTAAKWARKTVILSNGRKLYLKIYNLANGAVKFSYRGQLRKILGITDSAIHAHHIIPYSEGAHQLVQAAAKSIRSWHINDIFNGIPMPKHLHLSGHQAYTTAVKNKLTEIYQAIDISNLDEAYDALMRFCEYIKDYIKNNPNLSAGELVNHISQYTHLQ